MKRYSIPAVSALLAILVSPACADNHAENNSPQFIRTSSAASFDTDFTVAAEKTVNAVVCIKSFTAQRQNPYTNQGGGYDPFGMFDFFFGPQQRQQQPRQHQRDSEPVQSGLGSGVIISEDGYIVTNNHVIAGADRLEVLLNDNSTFDAKVIGTDEATDLALIKIDAEKLSPITFGDSEQVKIGEWVLAVGNPFGFNFYRDGWYCKCQSPQSWPERQKWQNGYGILHTDGCRPQSGKFRRCSCKFKRRAHRCEFCNILQYRELLRVLICHTHIYCKEGYDRSSPIWHGSTCSARMHSG